MKLFFKPILFVAALLDVVQVSADNDFAELDALAEQIKQEQAEEVGNDTQEAPIGQDAPEEPAEEMTQEGGFFEEQAEEFGNDTQEAPIGQDAPEEPAEEMTQEGGFFEEQAEEFGNDTQEEPREHLENPIDLARAFYETNCDAYVVEKEHHVNAFIDQYEDEMLVSMVCSDSERGRIMADVQQMTSMLASVSDAKLQALFGDYNRLLRESSYSRNMRKIQEGGDQEAAEAEETEETKEICKEASTLLLVEAFDDNIAPKLESADICKAEVTNELGMRRAGYTPNWSIIRDGFFAGEEIGNDTLEAPASNTQADTEGDGFFAADQPVEDSGQDAPTEEDVFQELEGLVVRDFYETNCDAYLVEKDQHVNAFIDQYRDEMLVSMVCSDSERGRIMTHVQQMASHITSVSDAELQVLFGDHNRMLRESSYLRNMRKIQEGGDQEADYDAAFTKLLCKKASTFLLVEHFDKIALALESVDNCKAEVTNELAMLRMGDKPQWSIIQLVEMQ